MAFLETPRFPDEIAFWMVGGRGFMTIVVDTYGGQEYRNAAWSQTRGEWAIQGASGAGDAWRVNNSLSSFSLQALVRLFRAAYGQLYAFRFKDWSDYTDDGNGILNAAGVGYGGPSYQLYKKYALAPLAYQQIILKPVSASVVVLRNGVAVTVGAGPGQIAISYTTGAVTFVADASKAISGAWTPGNPSVFTLSGALAGATAGALIYITGATGTAASKINGIPLVIVSNIANVVTVTLDTTGLTASGGTAFIYPQVADVLTWTGQYDVPVRFAEDMPKLGPDPSGAMWDWTGLKVIEVRNP